MAEAITRLVVDCRVVVTWNIPTEDHAAVAEALFVDWEHHVVDVVVPPQYAFVRWIADYQRGDTAPFAPERQPPAHARRSRRAKA